MSAPNSNGNTLVRHLVGAAGAIVLAGCTLYLADRGYGERMYAAARHSQPLEFALFMARAMLAVLALFAVAVVVHECGHAVAAFRMRMIVLSMRLWPFDLLRRRRGIRVRRAASAKPIACVVAMPGVAVPVDTQLAWLAAGGPAANAVAATAAIAMQLAWSAGAYGHAALGVFAAINLYLGIGNLLPIGRDVASDGTQLRRALAKTRAKDYDEEHVRHVNAIFAQVQYPPVAPETIARWQASLQPRVRASGFYTSFRYTLGAGDMTQISAAYTALVAGLRALGPQGYAVCNGVLAVSTFELVYEYCIRGGAVEEGEKRLQALGWMRRLVPRSLVLRVETCMAFRRGERERALHLYQRACVEASGDFVVSVRNAELSKLDELSRHLAAPAA